MAKHQSIIASNSAHVRYRLDAVRVMEDLVDNRIDRPDNSPLPI